MSALENRDSRASYLRCPGIQPAFLVGAAAPVVLTSRADSPEAKLYSIALAVLMANLQRTETLKIGAVHY